MNRKAIHRVLSKALSIALVIMLVGSQARLSLALAQEAPPEPTPTTSDVSVSNDSTQTTTSDSTANTGGDAIGTPAPTPDPTITDVTVTPTPDPAVTPDVTPAADSLSPTDTPTPEATDSGITIDNTGTVTDNTTADVNSGYNSTQSTDGGGEHHDGSGQSSAISTGDAVSVTNVDNSVNTTSINSQVVYQTINLYIDQNGDIDLSMPAELARALVTQNPDAATINAAIASVSNDATATTEVTGSSNTGGNTADGTNVTIHTGDAITLMSILNRINFVMIDSVVHVVTINIFGNLTGNILLPDLLTGTNPACPSCGSLSVTNGATVTNNVDVTADTGHNTATAGDASITTGNAYGNIKIINLINTVLYGTSTYQLYILDHGLWNGSFLGWAGSGASSNGLSVDPAVSQCPTCIAGAEITNTANLTNNISASATTGNNSATGHSADITTGDAFTAAAILNFVNTSLIRSFGFFGFINVMGSWTGNIGSKSLFAGPAEPEATSEDSGGGAVREEGGLLTMTQTNNVGDHVNPGDTVTFFLTLKNPGNGRVFDTNVILHLFKNGVDVGGTTIPVGTIKIGGTVKVTTGLQLSPKAPGGPYIAHAVATGHVGSGSDTVTASANSMFTISGAFASGGSGEPGAAIVAGSAPPNVQVLGATTRPTDNPNILLALLVLLALVPEYIFYRATRNRRLVTFVFTSDVNWQARLRAVQTLLL